MMERHWTSVPAWALLCILDSESSSSEPGASQDGKPALILGCAFLVLVILGCMLLCVFTKQGSVQHHGSAMDSAKWYKQSRPVGGLCEQLHPPVAGNKTYTSTHAGIESVGRSITPYKLSAQEKKIGTRGRSLGKGRKKDLRFGLVTRASRGYPRVAVVCAPAGSTSETKLASTRMERGSAPSGLGQALDLLNRYPFADPIGCF